MADDIQLNPGTGGDKVAAEEVGDVKHQRVRVQHGAAGAPVDTAEATPLPVRIADGGGVVSADETGNSSIIPLGSAGVFTGTGEDVSEYSEITVFASSDVVGSLSMELSVDGVNWDRKVPVAVGGPTNGTSHTVTVVSRFFRVVYTNGAAAQAHLRLQTIYHPNKSNGLTARKDELVTESTDVRMIRVVNDPHVDRARGIVDGQMLVHKFGALAGLIGMQDICGVGGIYPWPITAETLRVRAGGDAADAAAGNGAQKVLILGVDANFDLISEEVTLAGVSQSAPTTLSFMRVYRAYVTDVGTYGEANTGVIDIENTTTLANLARIESGIGQTQMTMYTVPAGFTAFLDRINVGVTGSKDASFRFFQRQAADDSTAAPYTSKRLVWRIDEIGGPAGVEIDSHIQFPEKTDLWLTGIEGPGGGGGPNVEASYSLVLVGN